VEVEVTAVAGVRVAMVVAGAMAQVVKEVVGAMVAAEEEEEEEEEAAVEATEVAEVAEVVEAVLATEAVELMQVAAAGEAMVAVEVDVLPRGLRAPLNRWTDSARPPRSTAPGTRSATGGSHPRT
jgi:hypothetical protein